MVKKFLVLSMLDSRVFFQLSPFRSEPRCVLAFGLKDLIGIKR